MIELKISLSIKNNILFDIKETCSAYLFFLKY